MSNIVTVRLSDQQLDDLDRLQRAYEFETRGELLRLLVDAGVGYAHLSLRLGRTSSGLAAGLISLSQFAVAARGETQRYKVAQELRHRRAYTLFPDDPDR